MNPLSDIFFPRSCLCSGRRIPPGSEFRYLHPEVASHLITVRGPHCRTCGHPFWGEAEESTTCPHCIDLDAHFREGRTAALMREPARRMILELKYRRGFYMIPDLVLLTRKAEGYREFLEGAVIVPVPLHFLRHQRRGFNQSLVLAKAVTRGVSRCRVRNLLKRIRNTKTQTRLRRSDRKKNIENAFALRRKVIIDPGERYLLFDDVFTTGSTLNACARVLLQSGASRVDVATICHG